MKQFNSSTIAAVASERVQQTNSFDNRGSECECGRSVAVRCAHMSHMETISSQYWIILELSEAERNFS